jgi:translation initiation factor 4E
MAANEAGIEVTAPTTGELVTEQPQPQPQPHKLERKWTFWFDNQSKQGAAWGTCLRKVYSFDTVEDFWWHVFPLSIFSFIFSISIARSLFN